MKNNCFKSFLLIILVFTISSCDFSFLTSGLEEIINSTFNDYNQSNTSYGYFEKKEDNTGNSLELLNQTFNGKKNINNEDLYQDFSNYELKYEDFEGSDIVQINKNITDYEYLEGYTPSTGNINGLVIPVDFVDFPFNKEKVYNNTLVNYQSVSSYYYNSSFGKLNYSFDILPWYRASQKSSYYSKMTSENQSKFSGDAPGVSSLIHEILTVAAQTYDLSKYDSNKDGYIDSLHIIYNHPIDYSDSSFWWAFQYITLEKYKYDGLYSFPYVFASINFLFEDNQTNNARTFIHETGHMLGLEDYYDYDEKKGYNKGSIGGFDMMDCSISDHNSFSKISLGWIDKVLLIDLNKNEEITVTINDSSSSGNVIMVCDNFDKNKGMFQSYFLFELIDVNSPLIHNEIKNLTIDGVRVYRVNAQLKTYNELNYEYEYYQFDNSYSLYNLIDAINAPNSSIYSKFIYNNGIIMKNSDLFVSSDKFYSLPFTNSDKSSYTFSINRIENNQATITFKRS